jgi:PII-like signaling protein
MTIPAEGMLLRIFIGESDRYSGKPLYEWLIEQAREAGLAGATALRGMMGFGAHSRMHSFKIERLSEDLPVIIECVDSAERLEAFLRRVEPAIVEGLATLEPVGIRFYRSRPSSSLTKDRP